MNGFFKSSRLLLKEITHQRHITGEWLGFLDLSHGSFRDTILLSILNKIPCPGWLSLMGDHHLGRLLRFYCHDLLESPHREKL
jgi:hypothetical protein